MHAVYENTITKGYDLTEILETIEEIFEIILEWAVLIIEITGAAMIIAGFVKALAMKIGKKEGSVHTLLHSLGDAIEFLLAGELLHSISVKDWKQLIVLAGMMGLRYAVTLMIKHHEDKQ